MGIRSYPKGTNKYRVVCADTSHTMHAYEKATLQKAQDTVTLLNAETAKMPYTRTCGPWQVEVRWIDPWEPV